MTAQISDNFRYREQTYALAGVSEGGLFDPAALDMKPMGRCSACWRGYQALFGLSGKQLVLDELQINLVNMADYERLEGPIIRGVYPEGPRNEQDWFNNHYQGLGYPLEYTGGLLIADGFIQTLYVHMGFHPAWKYERVVELIFTAGVLQAEHDHSEEMAEIRERFTDQRSEAGVRAFIERAFDRRY